MRAIVVVGLCAGRAKRRDLDDVAAEADVCQAKTPADQAAVAEQLLDLIGIGVRDDVEVFGMPVEQQVADTAADEKRLETSALQPIQNFESVGRDVGPADVVFRARDDDRTVARL
jgi:hypothetical protein